MCELPAYRTFCEIEHEILNYLQRYRDIFEPRTTTRVEKWGTRFLYQYQGLQFAVNDSVQQGRTTMLDFYADWCISCKEMEKYTFTHPGVLSALGDTATLQADVTANDAIDTELMSSMGIYGPPAILFFDRNGQEIRNRRVVGEMSGEEFAAHINATFQ